MKFSDLLKPIELPAKYSQLTQIERASVRQEYVHRQKGLCWFCKEPLKSNSASRVTSKPLNMRLFPKGFLNHPVHLHHDHTTDLTIGAVHARCNGYLWQYLGE